MNNLRVKIDKFIEEYNSKKNKEQEERVKRLNDLIDEQNNTAILFHPMAYRKRKKEIEELQRQVDSYHGSNLTFKKLVIFTSCIAFVIIFFVSFIVIGIICENREEKSGITDYNEEYIDYLSDVESSERFSETTSSTIESENIIGVPENELNSFDESISSDELVNCSQITIDDIDIRVSTDYSHLKSETILLGKNEGATFTITVNQKDVKNDDIIVGYDEKYIKLKLNKPITYENSTILKFYITGLKTGSSNIEIATRFDVITNDINDVKCYSFAVKKLDKKDGRIVYITPNGAKYHLSAKCAGKDAIKTTMYDVLAFEYDPCKKCAK